MDQLESSSESSELEELELELELLEEDEAFFFLLFFFLSFFFRFFWWFEVALGWRIVSGSPKSESKSVGISVVTSLVVLNPSGLDGRTSDRGRSLVV